MLVHLITRVNLKYDEKFTFTIERMMLLTKYVRRAVKDQTNKDFVRIGLVDESTPPEDMMVYSLTFDKIYKGEGMNSYKQYLDEYKGQEVLSIRLDSDDVPATTYVEAILDGVNRVHKKQMIVANVGIDKNIDTGEWIKVKVDYPIGFFGLYEKELSVGCYEKPHTEMSYNVKYLGDTSERPEWTRLLHKQNRGSKDFLTKYKI